MRVQRGLVSPCSCLQSYPERFTNDLKSIKATVFWSYCITLDNKGAAPMTYGYFFKNNQISTSIFFQMIWHP